MDKEKKESNRDKSEMIESVKRYCNKHSMCQGCTLYGICSTYDGIEYFSYSSLVEALQRIECEKEDRERESLIDKLENLCDERDYCEGCPIHTECAENAPYYFDDLSIDGLKVAVAKFGTGDPVDHPNHYCTGKYECIDVMIEIYGVQAVKDFCKCNAFKYLYRSERKNKMEDMKKAIWYLHKYEELCKEETSHDVENGGE